MRQSFIIRFTKGLRCRQWSNSSKQYIQINMKVHFQILSFHSYVSFSRTGNVLAVIKFEHMNFKKSFGSY